MEDDLPIGPVASAAIAILEEVPEAMALCRDGRFVYVNAAAASLLGYDRGEELVGRDACELARDEHGASDGDAPKKRRAMQLVRRDGSLVDVELTRTPIVLDGKPAIAAFARDLSERKRLEAQLRLADRVASVGTLAAGVAHEINNPLAYVIGNIEFVAGALDGGAPGTLEELRDALRDAREGAARVHAIVQQLRSFARGEQASSSGRARIDVRRAIADAERIASIELRHRARVVRELGPVPLVDANAAELTQVFLNLLVNAAQAIPDGDAEQHEVRISTRTSHDGRAVVAVRDSGVGIPPELHARIFDPFFTTKPVGVGTGLGLSVCIGIVTSLGGEIKVDSAPGLGSVFTVSLPPAPAPPSQPGAAPEGRGARGRILVIDDEPLVGTAIRRAIGDRHDVLVVTRAREALAKVAGGEAFDAVVCDLMMPEMSGMQMHAQLLALDPALADKVLFITGGVFTPAATEFLARVGNPRLEKPLEVASLLRILSDWLE